MLSSARLSPLNSSTTAVSSSLSSFSSFSPSSSSPVQIDYNRNRPSLLSFKSLLSPFVLTLFRILVCLALFCLVCSAPETASPKLYITAGNGTQHLNRSKWDSNITDFQSDRPQKDEPPRDMDDFEKTPSSWSQQSQGRMAYLLSNEDQYLQIKDDKVTGTYEVKPIYGILRFYSHEKSILIRSYHDNKTLCMNNRSEVYMAGKENPECYIKEAHPNGSLLRNYEFIIYSSTGKKHYLGINCDPILGIQTNQADKSTRFTIIPVTEEDLEKAKQQMGQNSTAAAKCDAQKSGKTKRKLQRQKLRWRWCWNLRVQKRSQLLKNCKEKHKKKCGGNAISNRSRKCVCTILHNMLRTKGAKRAKRKCLVEKITKWVKKQKQEPNEKTIMDAAKLLLPSYSKIARRQRSLMKASKRKKLKYQGGNPQPPQSGSHPRRHEGSSRRRGRKGKRKTLRLNIILGKYKSELFLSPNTAQSNIQQPNRPKTSSREEREEEQLSLSHTFMKELESLSEPARRHRKRKRRGRKHRRQRARQSKLSLHPERQSHPQTGTPIKSGASSPG